MPGPRGSRAPDEPSWTLRVPFMLVMAAFVSCLLSAIERPPTRARSGPEAVRVRGVDGDDVERLRHGLSELTRRVSRLRRALLAEDGERFEDELAAFDAPLPGWEAWPDLRTGGEVLLGASGGRLRGWPDTTASGLLLDDLDLRGDRVLARARIDLALTTARGLSGAVRLAHDEPGAPD